jgi:hypothetical protein
MVVERKPAGTKVRLLSFTSQTSPVQTDTISFDLAEQYVSMPNLKLLACRFYLKIAKLKHLGRESRRQFQFHGIHPTDQFSPQRYGQRDYDQKPNYLVRHDTSPGAISLSSRKGPYLLRRTP